MRPKLVLIDRDGVINHDSIEYIKNESEWIPIKDSLVGIREIQRLGIKVAICTNQAGVERGLFSLLDLLMIHDKLNKELRGAGGSSLRIFFCPHNPGQKCNCRKPRPQLLQTAMDCFGLGPKDTVFVGDSVKDIEAAKKAGCDYVLVETGNGKESLVETGLLGSRQHIKDLFSYSVRLAKS